MGLPAEETHPSKHRELGLLLDDPDDFIGAATEAVIVRPAMDSGAVAPVIHPKELPSDARPVPNTTGKHFVGANKSKIERFGSCDTLLEGEHGAVGCTWQLADVSRPLHSVACTTGPIEAPEQDVLFNAGRCVVVAPGIVEKILKTVTPIAEYKREGNLYIGTMKMSSFTRPATST